MYQKTDKPIQIGDYVKKGNNPIEGRVLDIKGVFNRSALVGWRVKAGGKLFLKTKWVRMDKLTLYIPPKRRPWYKRLFKIK